jgi:N-methylhydantoinase B/oxoprolinase/acetone carboxylase alpha subunit
MKIPKTQIDPVSFEVVRNGLTAICNEMALTVVC